MKFIYSCWQNVNRIAFWCWWFGRSKMEIKQMTFTNEKSEICHFQKGIRPTSFRFMCGDNGFLQNAFTLTRLTWSVLWMMALHIVTEYGSHSYLLYTIMRAKEMCECVCPIVYIWFDVKIVKRTHAPPVENESGKTIFLSISFYSALFWCHCHTFSALYFSFVAAFVCRAISCIRGIILYQYI